MTLLEIAAQCEAAPEEQQREVLERAFGVVFPGEGPNTHRRARFEAALNCRAYESAALMLVPEGWEFVRLERERVWPPIDGRWEWWVTLIKPFGKGYAKTPANARSTAIAAASLRAITSITDGGEHG